MTDKEKAKAYDEALERAKDYHKQLLDEDNPEWVGEIEKIFPELKESEEENIRKELLDYCKSRAEKYPNDPKYKNISAWISWLEKQENKPIKSEVSLPSFDEQQGTPIIDIPFGAKDSELQEASYHIPEGFHVEIQGNKVVIKKGEKNLTWDKGDDAYKLFAISAVEDYYDKENPLHKDLVDWLESLKNRVLPQPKEWSETDEKCIRLCTDIINSALRAGFCVQLDRDRCVDWLKSLSPQDRWKPSEKQIIALRWVLNNIPYNKHKEEISGLLDQIKGL